jgi:hypothetical protein
MHGKGQLHRSCEEVVPHTLIWDVRVLVVRMRVLHICVHAWHTFHAYIRVDITHTHVFRNTSTEYLSPTHTGHATLSQSERKRERERSCNLITHTHTHRSCITWTGCGGVARWYRVCITALICNTQRSWCVKVKHDPKIFGFSINFRAGECVLHTYAHHIHTCMYTYQIQKHVEQ